MRCLSLPTAGLLATAAVPAFAGPVNLLANGGFESGRFDPWTVSSDTSGLAVQQHAGTAQSGQWYVVFDSQPEHSLADRVRATTSRDAIRVF